MGIPRSGPMGFSFMCGLSFWLGDGYLLAVLSDGKVRENLLIIPSDQGPTFMISSNPTYFPKTPSPNIPSL